MEKTGIKSIEDTISKNMETYSKLEISNEAKAKQLGIISKETKLINDVESHSLEMDLKRVRIEGEQIRNKAEEDRIKLEKSKFKQLKLNEQEKLKLEELKLEIEKSKLDFEQYKFAKDQGIRMEDLKNKKWDRIANIGLKTLEIIVPLAVNATLVMMNFRLIYKDDGRVPSEMRDLMKNVYRG